MKIDTLRYSRTEKISSGTASLRNFKNIIYYPNNLEFRVLVCSDFPLVKMPPKNRGFLILLYMEVWKILFCYFLSPKNMNGVTIM